MPDRSRPLDHELAALEQERHGRRGGLLVDDDEVVEVRAEDRERNAAGTLDRDAVGDRERRLGLDRRAGLHGLRVGRAGRGLDADDLHVRLGVLDHEGGSGAQASPADRDHDLGEIRHVLEQLQPERPLTGDDRGVVERVHEREPFGLRLLERDDDALVDALAARVDDGAVAAGGLDLGHRRIHGDDDLAVHAAGGRAGGERLGVVARGGGDHAVLAALMAERVELRGDAADLERPGALQVLGLQRHRPARTLGERAGGEHRRAARDGLDRRACGLDVARGDGHSAMIASISTSAPIGRAATPIVVRAGGSLGK